MPAERAGYTVTIFLVDTSPSMSTVRSVDLPPGPDGEQLSTEITHLEWALQFVKLKIQEMIFNGRKTDQCGVILFGSEETKNIVNKRAGGYDHVSEYIPIAQPSARTLAKLDALQPSQFTGDPIDALIVGIETQANYLQSKKTWTRKIVMVTDGENPIEVEDWEEIVKKMDNDAVSLTIVGVDFDDDELPFEETDKSNVKVENEKFYHMLTQAVQSGIVGNLDFALTETTRPDVKQVRSTLMGTVLRLGDTDTRVDEAVEINVKTSKCTALARPKSWKKFALCESKSNDEDQMDVDNAKDQVYANLKMRTEFFVDHNAGMDGDGDTKMEEEEDDGTLLLGAEEGLDEEELKRRIERKEKEKRDKMQKVEKEELVRGFKYGTTYVPCPNGQFPKLPTRKGIDICGFFSAKHFRRELSMGEIQYVWADPSSPAQEVALSSIVQAMYEKNVMAIARWVSKDGMDPKMGVLYPMPFDEVDCLLWAQMPFADDVRKYTFSSLVNLISRKGEEITEHPYIPTEEQQEAMDNFLDAMDLMEAGERDEEGNRMPWFDTRLSFNPAIHRVKQAMFHAAVVQDIQTNPLPPPHPELLKYFNPPKRVLKRARDTIEQCNAVFKVKQVPKRVKRSRKDAHQHAEAEDDTMLLLDRKHSGTGDKPHSRVQIAQASPIASEKAKGKQKAAAEADDSDTEEDEDDEMILLDMKKPQEGKKGVPLPTPARSVSPGIDPGRAPGRIIGSTYPLMDFQKNISQGDVVSKAVEDLCEVIKEVIMRPFASRRSEEMLECMKVLRDTCLKEDEIDEWNAFVEDLKDKCLAKPGNPAFWSQVKKEGQALGLISKAEAEENGGVSTVSERKTEAFMS